MIVVLLGAPGAGKGTQAVGLAAALGALHLSTGDVLRANLREMTPLGVEAEGYMARGELVPDATVIAMVRERLGIDLPLMSLVIPVLLLAIGASLLRKGRGRSGS
jgi:adenylate kinase